jgi:hypothetical protein
MSKSAMPTLLVTFGEIRRWTGAFHAHQFRYGGGKLINESGEYLAICGASVHLKAVGGCQVPRYCMYLLSSDERGTGSQISTCSMI